MAVDGRPRGQHRQAVLPPPGGVADEADRQRGEPLRRARERPRSPRPGTPSPRPPARRRGREGSRGCGRPAARRAAHVIGLMASSSSLDRRSRSPAPAAITIATAGTPPGPVGSRGVRTGGIVPCLTGPRDAERPHLGPCPRDPPARRGRRRRRQGDRARGDRHRRRPVAGEPGRERPQGAAHRPREQQARPTRPRSGAPHERRPRESRGPSPPRGWPRTPPSGRGAGRGRGRAARSTRARRR